MAVPTDHTTRINPSDVSEIPLQDGHATKVTLKADPDIAFWEKSVMPPGYEGGDPIDTTTMFNTEYRTFAPRSLKTLTEVSFTAIYDPVIYDSGGVGDAINRNDEITVTFNDDSQITFYGYLKSFIPQEVAEGAQPEAAVTIQPTNWDSVNDVEAGMKVTETSGT